MPPLAIMGIGAGIGALGGLMSPSGPQSTKSTQTLTPYGDNYNYLNQGLEQSQRSYDWGQNRGPEQGYAVNYWNQMNQPQGGRGRGGDQFSLNGPDQRARGGGGGGSRNPYGDAVLRGGGGGGGGNKDAWRIGGGGGGGGGLGNLYATPDKYNKQVLEGYWLDSGNEAATQMIDRTREAGRRTLDSSLGAVDLQASGVGRTGGAQAAYQGAVANQRFQESQGLFEAQTEFGRHEAERGRMMQGLGMLSDQTMNLRTNTANIRQTKMSAEAQRFSAMQAASASRYGSRQSALASLGGSLYSKQATLGASRINQRGANYRAGLDYRLGSRSLGLQNKFGMFDRALALDQGIGRGYAGGYEQASGLYNTSNPILEGYGTTRGRNTVPGPSTSDNVLQGALGGAAMGWGIGNMQQGVPNAYSPYPNASNAPNAPNANSPYGNNYNPAYDWNF